MRMSYEYHTLKVERRQGKKALARRLGLAILYDKSPYAGLYKPKDEWEGKGYKIAEDERYFCQKADVMPPSTFWRK